MEIEGLNSSQWRLYDYLKQNCVGYTNRKKGKDVVIDLDYNSIQEFQKDIMALRRVLNRKIESCSDGYYLPLSTDKPQHFVKSKTYSHIYTALLNGDISKNELYKFLNEIRLDQPLDNQLKLMFGDYENAEVKVFSDDLIDLRKMERNALESEYKRLGGIIKPSYLTREELISEIKSLREEQKCFIQQN